MPKYNTYGSMAVVMKIGDLSFQHYDLFDQVNIPDGVYVCEKGTIVVKDGVFIAEYAPGQMLNFKGETLKVQAA